MQSLFVLLAVSLVVFFAVYAVGDPIELLVNAEASEADRQAMIRRLCIRTRSWSAPRPPRTASLPTTPRWNCTAGAIRCIRGSISRRVPMSVHLHFAVYPIVHGRFPSG